MKNLMNSKIRKSSETIVMRCGSRVTMIERYKVKGKWKSTASYRNDYGYYEPKQVSTVMNAEGTL